MVKWSWREEYRDGREQEERWKDGKSWSDQEDEQMAGRTRRRKIRSGVAESRTTTRQEMREEEIGKRHDDTDKQSRTNNR